MRRAAALGLVMLVIQAVPMVGRAGPSSLGCGGSTVLTYENSCSFVADGSPVAFGASAVAPVSITYSLLTPVLPGWASVWVRVYSDELGVVGACSFSFFEAAACAGFTAEIPLGVVLTCQLDGGAWNVVGTFACANRHLKGDGSVATDGLTDVASSPASKTFVKADDVGGLDLIRIEAIPQNIAGDIAELSLMAHRQFMPVRDRMRIIDERTFTRPKVRYSFDPARWEARITGVVRTAYTTRDFVRDGRGWKQVSGIGRTALTRIDIRLHGTGDTSTTRSYCLPGFCYFPPGCLGGASVRQSRAAMVEGTIALGGFGVTLTSSLGRAGAMAFTVAA